MFDEVLVFSVDDTQLTLTSIADAVELEDYVIRDYFGMDAHHYMRLHCRMLCTANSINDVFWSYLLSRRMVKVLVRNTILSGMLYSIEYEETPSLFIVVKLSLEIIVGSTNHDILWPSDALSVMRGSPVNWKLEGFYGHVCLDGLQ